MYLFQTFMKQMYSPGRYESTRLLKLKFRSDCVLFKITICQKQQAVNAEGQTVAKNNSPRLQLNFLNIKGYQMLLFQLLKPNKLFLQTIWVPNCVEHDSL